MNKEAINEMYTYGKKQDLDEIMYLINYLEEHSQEKLEDLMDDKTILRILRNTHNMFETNILFIISDPYSKTGFISTFKKIFKSKNYIEQLNNHLDKIDYYLDILENVRIIMKNVPDEIDDLLLVFETLILLAFSFQEETINNDMLLDNKKGYTDKDIMKIEKANEDLGFHKLSLTNKVRRINKSN